MKKLQVEHFDRLSVAGWKVEKLGDVCEIDKTRHQKNNLPYVGLEHIESNTGKFIGSLEPQKVKSQTFGFSDKHVLYGRLRPYLKKVLLPDFDGHCSTEIFPLKVSDRLDRRFLFHWLLSDEITEKINATSTGARMPRANMNQVLDLEIPIPPLPEQHRIVTLLDETFAGLAQVHANAERNLVNAREVFESYLKEVFENKHGGWEESSLGDIGKICMCKRIFKEQTTATGDIPFYKIGTFGKEPDAYISKEIYDEFRDKYSFPNKGDILISASGTIGRRVKYDGKPAYFQDSNIVWVENDETQVLNDYLYHFYGACNWNSTKGATIARLYTTNLKELKIAFPKSLEEQRAIVERLDGLAAETSRLEAVYQSKLEAVEELRKSVLKEAFEGRL